MPLRMGGHFCEGSGGKMVRGAAGWGEGRGRVNNVLRTAGRECINSIERKMTAQFW